MGVEGHAKVVESQDRARLVQESHDAAFAHDRRRRGHPDVDLFPVDVDRELAVLGPTAFDDVHVGHDLDSTHQARADRGR